MSKTYEVIEIQADGWEKVLRICKSKVTAERAAMLRRNALGLKGKGAALPEEDAHVSVDAVSMAAPPAGGRGAAARIAGTA